MRLGPSLRFGAAVVCLFLAALATVGTQTPPGVHVSTRMEAPRWAVLQRQLLAANVPA
jgi:hypothetical protein